MDNVLRGRLSVFCCVFCLWWVKFYIFAFGGVLLRECCFFAVLPVTSVALKDLPAQPMSLGGREAVGAGSRILFSMPFDSRREEKRREDARYGNLSVPLVRTSVFLCHSQVCAIWHVVMVVSLRLLEIVGVIFSVCTREGQSLLCTGCRNR